MEPIIKVRHKEKLVILLASILIHVAYGILPRCDKTPSDQNVHRIGGDNGFTIQVSGSPRKYRPNQVYTITLSVRTLLIFSLLVLLLLFLHFFLLKVFD